MKRYVPTELRNQAFVVLHNAGWPDSTIAQALHASPNTVTAWRVANDLPKNRSRIYKIDEQEARRMHSEGANDQAIADRFGVLPSGVCHWRRRLSLPANIPAGYALSDEDKRRARKMLRLGATRQQVAEALGRTRSSIQRLRRGMKGPGLRSTGISNRTIRSQVLKDGGLEKRLTRAIGTAAPLDVRSEAISAMYADVLEGRLARDLIEAQAASYRNRAYDMCGLSKFGARSLDEELSEGFSLLDALEDPDALEEMIRAAEIGYQNDNHDRSGAVSAR